MALQSRITERVSAESLGETWEEVGSGGFGQVYKAKHREWKFDVAIKLLFDGVGALEEANIMNLASCEFVLRVYGIFEGRPPVAGLNVRKGIVMEFMQKGCVQTLLQDLSSHPPWPLAFRLAHEVALGLNFLHSKDLIHNDLKPSNVLLNSDLHAKLADFGLSRVSASALNNNRETTQEVGGSYKYMPPEAFEDASYNPVRSFDIYSYGILLWSLVTGKEPYPLADYSLVALRIPKGDRPPLDEIVLSESEGLAELVGLMKRCWHRKANERPQCEVCCEVTEVVFSKHKELIKDSVSEVLARLVPPDVSASTPESSRSNETVDNNEPENVQHDVVRRMSDRDKATFVDDNRAELIKRVSDVMAIIEDLGDMVHSNTFDMILRACTSQEQMRILFRGSFVPGGATVKAAFYDILKKHYPYLVTSLGGDR